MSQENLTSQDKEELKRRLELLQQEYDRTAQRLQRAERREAVRKHVQNTISQQNQLLHINTSAILEHSSSSPELNPNTVPSDTAKVRFQLPDAAPFSPLTYKPSLSRCHRLRSKRSRLRLQIRERASDTEESQEKAREGAEERWREECGEAQSECEHTGDVERGHTDEERKQEEENKEQTELLMDELKQNEDDLTAENNQSAAESSPVSQSALLMEVHDPPADQSALRNSPSTSGHHSVPSTECGSQSCSVSVAEKHPGCSYFLTSCTLIDGLPFPVEYYVRTTRRMASARSSLDLNSVIQSQLSNGRGRRRSSRGRVTSQPSPEKPPGRNKSRKRGRRSDSLVQSPTSFLLEECEPNRSLKPSSVPEPESPLQSQVYPIFRRRCRQTGVSPSQAGVNDSPCLLPSLTSLVQALRTKDLRKFGSFLTICDVQDFHLPDEEFGRLKLQRLRASCPAVESLAYGASFRKNGSVNESEAGQTENQKVPLAHGACLERTFTEQLQEENTDQSEREEPVAVLHRCSTNPSEIHLSKGTYTQHIRPNGPRTPFASSSLMLNLSLSLTSHTLIEDSPSLVSVGDTPDLVADPPPLRLTPGLSVPPDRDSASEQTAVKCNGTSDNVNDDTPERLIISKAQMQECVVSEHAAAVNAVRFNADVSYESGATQMNISSDVEKEQVPKLTNDILIYQTENRHHSGSALPHNDCSNSTADAGDLYCTQTPTSTSLQEQTAALPDVSANQRDDREVTSSVSLVQTSRTHTRDSVDQHHDLSCGSLRKTHWLTALDGGCVLDVCLVRWPSDDWCVCVAGEWSVCVWKQNDGQWRLLHTWSFTQSVISLQGIPDSTVLLCVCLGRLEITEARTLLCPSTDSGFCEVDLCKGPLQAALGVSDVRVACCSAPGTRQNLQVFTLSQDGRIAETLSLVPTYESVQTLVTVEREKDALIGWTEHKSVLIWNMKSGQILQNIRLMDSVTTATCLRGFSYRGVLCVLLQQASVCHEESSSKLFRLIATNPLTGKYFTLSSISTASSPSERLIDGDVCESALVGVFQSGLTIWNLTGGVACVYANEPAEVCRLARWAGPNTLVTGYLNGDVHIYRFNP